MKKPQKRGTENAKEKPAVPPDPDEKSRAETVLNQQGAKSAQEPLGNFSLTRKALYCLALLRDNSRLGGDKTRDAIQSLLTIMRGGCELLDEIGADENSRADLRAAASVSEDWPIFLAPKPISFRSAKQYLKRIGVGTKSFPRTANTKIRPDDDWTKIAGELITEIIVFRGLLEMDARNEIPTDERSNIFEKRLLDARKWKQVLGLPEQLNEKTWKSWWPVAQEMLKDQWENNPVEATAIFDRVKKSAQADDKTPAGYASRGVRRAFKTMAIQGAQRSDSIPGA